MLAFPLMRKKPWPSLCLRTTPGIGIQPTFPPQPEQSIRQSWARSLMSKNLSLALLLIAATTLQVGCQYQQKPASTVTVLIESSPTNLDPRIGVDAQSERIDSLIFDSLVRKD